MHVLIIKFNNSEITAGFESGANLGAVLRENIPDFSMPCGGNHTCGKCRVRLNGKEVLACSAVLTGDSVCELNLRGESKILSWYRIPEVPLTEKGYGFAIDIGTTTVAVQLVDRETGKVLAERLQENAEKGYGADVISRIEVCTKEGTEKLSSLIYGQLERLTSECMKEAGIDHVEESVVTGNSTMLHIFEGLDPTSLAVVPFDVVSAFGITSRRTLAGAPVYLPRCISAYVGADIVCAILATGLLKEKTGLLADVGTNGEMALTRNGKIICCSTAAGPAFEGAGLSHGMPAAAGAINKVSCEDGVFRYETVGGADACGICGSGILDALSCMIKEEILDDTGYMDEDWEIAGSGVTITQKDVRQIQLAKSAVCAGIMTMMEHEEITAEEIDRFILAGGFGNSINTESAAAIGLFPAELEPKTTFSGNAALGGAYMLLVNPSLRAESEKFAEAAEEISLSSSPEFMEYYVDCMSF